MLNKSISQFLNFSISRSCRRQTGFTLIEMIVVLGLLSAIGLTAVNIFFTSLRGGVKAELLKEIKQNGDFAISTMERMIRNAREVTSTCVGNPESSITILNPDYQTTEFTCGPQIASNSTTFLTSSGISASTCSFTCQRIVSKPETVTIIFTLSQGGVPVRPEESASATFETTVSLRNY